MNKGFSTIEILIATMIMITAISAIFMTSFGNQNFLIGARTNNEALSKAKEILEIAQAEARKDFRMVNPNPIAPQKDTDGYYSWWTEVGPSNDADDHFIKKVTSHVDWTDESKITRNVKLSTLVSNFENAIGGDTCNSYLTGDWTNPQTTNILFSNLTNNDGSGTYRISDLEVYQKKIYVAVNENTQNTSPNSGTISISRSDVGTVSWSSPHNALANGGGSATASLNGGEASNYLSITNFGSNLNIPTGATILGIQVGVTRNASNSNSIIDNSVRLIKSDGTTLSALDRANTVTRWSTTPTNIIYGNSTNLWGESWTASDINDPDFGIVFSVKNLSSLPRTANIDYISVSVTYIKQFYVLDASDPTNPTLVGEIANNPTSPSANAGFNALTTDGKYVYVALDTVSGGQLQIIDTATNPYSVIKTFSVPGVSGNQGKGNSIFYKDGYIYLGLMATGISSNGPEFHIIDVRNPSAPIVVGHWPSSGNLGNNINAIKVRGDYAYLATPNSEELKIIDISDPTNPTLTSGFDAPDATGNGRSLDLVGNNLYLGRTFTSSNQELYVVDISDQANIPTTPLGIQEISRSVNALLIRDYLIFLISSTSSQEGKLEIWNSSDKSNLTPFTTSISLPNTSGGISNTFIPTMDCEGNYIYASSVPSSGLFANKGSLTIITAP